MERGWSDLVRLGLLMRRMALGWTLSRGQRVDFGAPPQTWEQYSKEGRIWDLHIDACLAREWMWVFQVRLDERERPSCVKEAEVSSSSPFRWTAGKFCRSDLNSFLSARNRFCSHFPSKHI